MKNIFLIALLLMLNACGDNEGDTYTDNTDNTNNAVTTTSTYTDYGDGTVTKCDNGECEVYLLDENYYESNDTNQS